LLVLSRLWLGGVLKEDDMTRNLLLASLLLLCAALLVAACDPARAARREVDRFTHLTQQTEIEVNGAARTALVDFATAEGHRRGQELKAAGCGPACATQPSGALIDPCKGVVAASEARYEKRGGEITAAQKKAYGAIDAVYAALRVVVDLVRTIEAGVKASGWEAKLAAVVAGGAKAYADCVAAVAAFKAAIGGVK
jgi:hypothetical protein